MSSEDILDSFERARELGGAAREAWLVELEARDPEAAQSLRKLLEADGRADSLLERQPPGLADLLRPEATPTHVGPYEIVRELGRGGMGRVFLAEQQGDGFTRKVAIKRLDHRDSPEASTRRFHDEIKILASLEHAGIARLLDGGRDVDGSGYLVLEYVEGLDLLAHVREHGLGLQARLRLFLEVLAAVAYAHGRRVVHRDLKPGNILVGPGGYPKLLDFGISKLLEPDGATSTLTRTGQRALTPAYASPEQIRGDAVTIASDIYSLGVMLYELVAGVRPFASSTDLRELERAVLEVEPEPPSTASRRAAATGRSAGASTATHEATFPLGRDLDAICLKALRKEPGRRYSSVDELASDVAAYLDGRPVAARRGGFAYRVGKAARRHRATLAVAGLAALLASATVVGSRWLTEPPPRASAILVPPPPRPTLSRIGELSARFAEDPKRADFGLELTRALLDAGRGADAMGAVNRLRQLPGTLGQGTRIDLAEAEAALAVSELQRAAAAAASARESARTEGDASLARRAEVLHARALLRLTQPEGIEQRLAELLEAADAAGDEHTAAESLLVRAEAARRGARGEEARTLLDQAMERIRALGARRLEVEGLLLQARLEGESGAIDEGLATVERALSMAVEIAALDGEASALLMKMVLLNWKGDSEASLEAAGLAVEKLRLSGNREQLVTILANLAIARSESGELARAEAVIAEAEPIAATLSSPRSRALIFRARAGLEEKRGNPGPARAAYLAAVAAAREAGVSSNLAGHLADLAWLEASNDRTDAAEAAAREAAGLFQAGGDDRSALEIEAVIAWVQALRGDRAGAQAYIARLRQDAAEGDSDSARYFVMVVEGRISEALGDYAKAVELRRATTRFAADLDSPGLELVEKMGLARVLEKAGRNAEAATVAREVLVEAERFGMLGIVRECREILGRTP